MSIFQIAATLFALFMIYWVRSNQKRAHLSTIESSLWYSVWCTFIILALFPNLLLGVVTTLHFARVFDLLVTGAFMVLVVLIFHIYIKNKKLEQKLETLVRKIALQKNNTK
jgi:hypothetical protein